MSHTVKYMYAENGAGPAQNMSLSFVMQSPTVMYPHEDTCIITLLRLCLYHYAIDHTSDLS